MPGPTLPARCTSTPLNVTLIAASSPVWAMVIGAAFYGVRPHRALLLGAPLSAALLGEWPQPFHGLAFALILAGIVVSSRPAPAAQT